MIKEIPDIAVPTVMLATTTRQGGVSQAPFDSFNLGDHVNDDPLAVSQNRQRLADNLTFTGKIQWLNQVHGNEVQEVCQYQQQPYTADAAFTREKGIGLAILTADCLPILLTNQQGTEIAAIHAGWRPLASGIIDHTLAKFSATGEPLIAWLGPCIGPEAFEVGGEVRDAFLALSHDLAEAFTEGGNGKYFANLHAIARHLLALHSVTQIHSLNECTFHRKDDYFSYRRDGQTGRMASIIAIRS